MLSSDLLAVFYGLTSAASWGAGDFSGGFATKRNDVYSVVLVSQLVGAIFLIGVALLMAEPLPAWGDVFYGSIAGISGVIGLAALYRGLSLGRMGVVAPVAAVVSAIVPAIIGIFLEGLPEIYQLMGFVCAILAVWLISRTDGQTKFEMRELGLPVVAGLGFGLFFIFIDRVSEGAVLWPLVAARMASVLTLFFVGFFTHQGKIPIYNQLPVMSLAGIFDSGGNAFFALAAQTGRLDISAVLASLYPATTILLAWLILKEKLAYQQWVGVGVALIAVILIAI